MTEAEVDSALVTESAATPTAPRPAGFVLRPGPSSLRQLATDLWASRELIVILSKRSFFVRYRRASLGILWAVGLPLVQAIVMSVVFTFAIRIHQPHYPVFVFGGLFAWSFFSAGLTAGATAIVDNANLSSRIYFPRAALPIVAVASNIYNFVVTVAILLIVGGIFGVWAGVWALMLIPGVILAVLLTTAWSLLLSGLHVYFRDVRYIVQAALTAWMYITPVFYPLRFLNHRAPGLRVIVEANPVTGVVEMFRVATTGADANWVSEVGVTCIWLVAIAIAAALVHRRFDRLFADLL